MVRIRIKSWQKDRWPDVTDHGRFRIRAGIVFWCTMQLGLGPGADLPESLVGRDGVAWAEGTPNWRVHFRVTGWLMSSLELEVELLAVDPPSVWVQEEAEAAAAVAQESGDA